MASGILPRAARLRYLMTKEYKKRAAKSIVSRPLGTGAQSAQFGTFREIWCEGIDASVFPDCRCVDCRCVDGCCHHLLGSDVAVKAVHCKRFRHFVVARERRGRVNVRLGADELVDLLEFRLPVSRRHG